ncbi:cupredoxin domain-containing protein [Streptomyces sp. NRRL S-241]|uniref:cupredoxin domain-containing protein n=1 Tax=Streptomyces sp. NRRL S-241 TaxID=1463896 RepID=UPI000ADB5BFE|nr:cupredoxin domain-containing protein [Streptomyces sp. NRRL S-241]
MTNRPKPRPNRWSADGPKPRPEHRPDDGSDDRGDRWPDGESRCDACRTPPPRAARRFRGTARAAALLALALLLAGGAATGCGGRATTHHKPGTSHEQASGGVGTLLTATDATGHRLREVPAQGAPEVQLTVRPDSEDGWNLQLAVKNYRFTPDSTGGAALPGAGHAHLELDGRKLARLYGPWFHLPAAQVPEGAHTLTVRLYADDHTAWAVSGKPVEGTAQLTAIATAPGQAGGHSHGESPAPAPAPTPAPEQADRTVAITVQDGKVSPAPARTELRRGERVALRVTSDRADTLHVHGYDKELVLPAGQEATLILTADRTGLFEVETHESNLVLTQLLVR